MAAVQDTAVAVGTGASSRPAAQGRLARIWASHGAGYMFLLPWLIGFFGLTLGPAIASLYLSFTNFDLIRAPEWIGTANYARIATADPKFAAAVKVTFLYVVLSVPFKLAFALLVAILLDRGVRGSPSIGRSSTCRRCLAAASLSPCSGGSSLPATA
jgi:multiple sugar transport system permease protein